MIIYGTGTYTLRRFAPNELGLFDSSFNGFEFLVLKRYAHLYWIPVFPIGTVYALKQPNSSDKYEVSDEGLKSLMKQQPVSLWWHSLAFAGPLLLILGLTFNNVQSQFQQAASEKAMAAQIETRTKVLSDTASLRPYASQFKNILNCFEKSESEKPLHVDKIDTSENKMFPLIIKCFAASRDTTIPYNTQNILISKPDLSFIPSHNNNNTSTSLEYYYENCFVHNKLSDRELLKWYYSGFKQAPPTQSGYDVTDVKAFNERLAQYKYIANVFVTGYAEPSLEIREKRFHSGYISAKVVVCEIGSNKTIEKYDIIASNSDSLSFTSFNNREVNSADINSRLESNLIHNLNREVEVSLRLLERKNIKQLASLPF